MARLRVVAPVRAPVEDERVTRAQLLEAASAVMIEQGTPDVSLQAIAGKAGVTAPLVKYYFGSKDGLLLALAQRDTGRALEQVHELMGMDLDPRERLRLHIVAIVRTYALHPYLNGLLNLLLKDEKTASAQAIRGSFIVPLTSAQARMLRQGARAGVFRSIDTSMFYFMVVGACQYIFSTRVAVNHLLNGAPVDEKMTRAYADAVVDFVFNGILSERRAR